MIQIQEVSDEFGLFPKKRPLVEMSVYDQHESDSREDGIKTRRIGWVVAVISLILGTLAFFGSKWFFK